MISVIIPVYNTAPYLEKCLDSIVAQTYADIEVIVVDDGSSDESGSICDKYAQKDERITVLHQKNQGVSVARNHALKLVKGDWVSFVDSDDWLEADMYRKMLEIAEKTAADVVICDVYDEREDKQTYRDIWGCIPERNELIFKKEEKFFYGFSYTPVLWNKLISKSLVEEEKFSEDCAYGEDTLFLSRVVTKARRMVGDSTPLYHYRRNREGNVVSAPINPKVMDLLKAYDEVAERMVAEEAYDAAIHLIYIASLQVIFKISLSKLKESKQYLREAKRLVRKYKRYIGKLKHNPRTTFFRRSLFHMILYSPSLCVFIWNMKLQLKQYEE